MNKFLKVLNHILTTMLNILTGMSAASMWITHDDLWKNVLPAILLIISFKLTVVVKEEE